ncbi:MAG: (1-_4)-alpha-D-glucan 1-alpha-D-glucosylmutase, partial [Gammaproteobacteria bacterium]
MPITDHQGLDALCEICGITLSYYDIRGHRYETSTAVKQSLLTAMGLFVEENSDLQRHLEEINSRAWQSIINPMLVQQKNHLPVCLTLTLNETQINARVSWELQLESGQNYQGHWAIDPHQAIDEREVNNIHLKKFELSLDIDIDIGYHQLIIKAQGDTEKLVSLIITPASCYLPEKLAGDGKIWGLSLQLYTLRSRRNWGIGDFADLHSLIEILAPLGVDVIGLNPLHALYSHLPEKASPYSPSSRDFLNPIYVDVEAIEELKHCQSAKQRISGDQFQARLQELRSRDRIAYVETWSLKLEVLKMLYVEFQRELLDTGSMRTKSFRQFQQDGGEDLFRFTVFEALQSFFHEQDACIETWQQWPEAYRDPDSDSTEQWAQSNIADIEFYQYLQWTADR